MAFLRSNPDPGDPPRPGARERARMRRRLRRQREMREALLLDLGALVFELHRQGRREPELLQAKAAELTAVDEEVRALAEALDTDATVMQLVATGVAGSCESCGSLMSVDARYCASCGAPAMGALAADGGQAAALESPAPGPAFAHPGFAGEQAYADEAGVEEEIDVEDRYPGVEEAATTEAEAPAEEAAAEDESLAEEYATADEGYALPEDEPVAEEQAVAEEEALADDEVLADEDVPEPEEAPERAGFVAVEPEPVDEGVISVSTVEPEEKAEGQQEPEPEPPWGAPESEAEVTQVQPAEERDEPPRALADDAIDTAAKAIRSGFARMRDSLRGRRSGT